MDVERVAGPACGAPFPIHRDLVAHLAGAHASDTATRNTTVAHVLGTCAGYSYGNARTVAATMSRVGLEDNACVRITETVDAMFIVSTAYLVQSRCGRVVVLCYRGTEPANILSWLGDADVASEALRLDDEVSHVHGGFYRNLRATRLAVLAELRQALLGRSLLDPDRTVEHPLEALYVTGHSLGGAMAVLFALMVLGCADHRALAGTLRAVYTFGQPMAIAEPLPRAAGALARRVFRHVLVRDLVPALPPALWGRYAHVGTEHRYGESTWRLAESPTAQLEKLREIPRSVMSFLAPMRQRGSSKYSIADHGPHHYISALRPPDCVTEFGDRS